MTTETAPDPIIHDWSNDLEQELVETGMEDPQAKVFARAFELGMMRVLSVMATKEELFQTKQELKQEFKDGIGNLRSELKDEIANLRSEVKDEIANLRREMRFQFVILAGLMAGLMGGIIAKL